MLKKSILAAAIAMVSLNASADLTLSNGNPAIDFASTIFSDDVEINTQADVMLTVGTTLSNASGTLTYTLPTGVSFADQVVKANLTVDNTNASAEISAINTNAVAAATAAGAAKFDDKFNEGTIDKTNLTTYVTTFNAAYTPACTAAGIDCTGSLAALVASDYANETLAIAAGNALLVAASAEAGSVEADKYTPVVAADFTLGTVEVLDGGELGSSTVTFSVVSANLVKASTIDIALPALEVSEGSSSNQDISVSSSKVNAAWDAKVKGSADLYNVVAGAVGSVNTAGAMMKVDLATRKTLTTGNSGVAKITFAGKQANGTDLFAPGSGDELTVTVNGDLSAMESVSYGATALTINEAMDSATGVVSGAAGASAFNQIVQFKANGKDVIELSDYSVELELDYNDKDFTDVAYNGQLESTSYSGLQAADSAAIVTKAGVDDVTYIRVTNNNSSEAQLFAQLITQNGEVRELVELDAVPANTTIVLDSEDVEAELGGTFNGRARINFQTGSNDDLTIITTVVGEAGVTSQVIGD